MCPSARAEAGGLAALKVAGKIVDLAGCWRSGDLDNSSLEKENMG